MAGNAGDTIRSCLLVHRSGLRFNPLAVPPRDPSLRLTGVLRTQPEHVYTTGTKLDMIAEGAALLKMLVRRFVHGRAYTDRYQTGLSGISFNRLRALPRTWSNETE